MANHQQILNNAPSLRLCLIRKTQQNPEYGFNLHAERNKSQYVGAVDSNSPAERGGLRQGDRIFGVNGALIENETHKEVVQRIKTNPNECELLVIDAEGLKWYEENGIAITYALPNIVRPGEKYATYKPTNLDDQTYVSTARIELRGTQRSNGTADNEQSRHSSVRPPVTVDHKETGPNSRSAPLMSPRPLLCILRKQGPTDEFGFNLHAERNKGHFIGAVDQGGIADLAGLETGQRIVGVNGKLVYPTSQHKEVVALIKGDPLETSLLVASEEVDRWYNENGIPYSFDLAIVHETARKRASVAPQPHSRTATATSHQAAGTSPNSRHNSVMSSSNSSDRTFYMLQDDVATNAVYIPPELQPPVIEESTEEVVMTAVPNSTSDLQDIENAAVGTEADDLLEQVFTRVKPPEVEAAELRHQNGLMNEFHETSVHAQSEDTKHTITNYNSQPLTVSPPISTVGSSHHHVQAATVTYTPASQIGTSLNSPHSDKRSLDSPDSHKDENIDIFKLSAKEARQMMRHKRKDPRLQTTMTLEEKHQLIANL